MGKARGARPQASPGLLEYGVFATGLGRSTGVIGHRMSLLVLGINHRSAPVAVRERVAFAPDQLEMALGEAQQVVGVDELVILSTCNRTEICAVAEPDLLEHLLHWLAGYHHLPEEDVRSSSYRFTDEEALRHLMRVASGLDSMVLGEPQILGQMKSAYAVAQEAGVVGAQLGRIYPHVFSVAKRVRTDTAIGENPVSVAYAAVSMTHRIFSDLRRTTALLVGAGETIELVARHLCEQGVRQVIVANRTLHRARELADRFGAEAVLLGDIPEQLVRADIVITSTASQLPILGKGAVESALKRRKHRPMFMVDIAVPRDIETQVADLNDVYLYTIDDLREVVEENRRSREQEARKADEIIATGVAQMREQMRALDAVVVVRAMREKAERLRDAELDKAMRQLARGESPEQVLAQLARGLTNKLLHSPSSQMRKASASGRNDVIVWSQELFELDDSDGDDSRS